MKGKKTGGKQKGYTAEPIKKATELFVSILEGEVDHIKGAFEEVRLKDKAKYLELYAKYAQYFIPKKTEVENNHKFDSPAVIDWGNSTKASLPTDKTK
jgi:hypothetical protein